MQTIDRRKIGATLRRLRGERPQADIAAALGVTTMAISQYESGARVPNDDMKIKIAAFFGKGVEELFFAE